MSPNPSVESHTRAIVLGLVGVAMFSGMDALIKYLGATEHPFAIALGRYIFALPFAGLIWLRAGRPQVTAEMWRAHALRGAVIASSSSLFFWAVSVVPLAEVITLSFIAPLLIPFVAAVVLKEKLRWANVAASAAGFAGAVIAVSGGKDGAVAAGGDGRLYELGVIAMVAFSAGYALSVVLLRARARKGDGSAIIGVLATLLPAVFVAAPAFSFGHAPADGVWPAYLFMGALGAVSMWTISEAYARAEAQVLAPLEFTALPWAALFGFVFFAEVPRPQMWLGAAIIVAACLWSSWVSARAGAATGGEVGSA